MSLQQISIKRWLYPLLAHPRAKQTLKWIVYSALIINTALYLQDDIEAFIGTVPDDAGWLDIVFQFITTIDSVAWLGLVFLFELETYMLSDSSWTRPVEISVRGLRFLCYGLIGFAAVGYTAEALDTFDPKPTTISAYCDVADQDVYAQISANEFPEVTAENCASLPGSGDFVTLADELAVVATSLLGHLQLMGVLDIINAVVWILVVLLIELEVWMQSADRFASRALAAARQVKTVFYLVLISNGVLWFYHDYWLYAWDAFLWIFGFWAIELNLAEWEAERLEELQAA